jgi:hypothetical protein
MYEQAPTKWLRSIGLGDAAGLSNVVGATTHVIVQPNISHASLTSHVDFTHCRETMSH